MLDHILQAQSAVDAGYFMRLCERSFSPQEQHAIRETVLRAYRWQFIASGAQHPHYMKLLGGMVSRPQMQKIQAALAPIIAG